MTRNPLRLAPALVLGLALVLVVLGFAVVSFGLVLGFGVVLGVALIFVVLAFDVVSLGLLPVSYKHLRAHETVLVIVCPLQLEIY